MKARLSWAFLLLCLGGIQRTGVAQKTPVQQTVSVVVVNAEAQPAQPVPMVRVSLGYLDNAVLVTEARSVTNPRGQTWLDVSENAAQRGNLRIEIVGANNLVIYQPADGQLEALPATIKVSMLPKGSPALLGPAQIEAMLHRALLRVSILQRQVSGLKQAAQNQKPDPGPVLAEWAQAMGFPAAQVDQQVQQWAHQVQSDSAQASVEDKALAEFALKHYANAAQLFDQAANSDRDSIDATEAQVAAVEKAALDRVRGQVKQLVSNSQQGASSFQLNLQFHNATEILETASETASAEFKKHPDDKGLHELWLRVLALKSEARRMEGASAPASQSLALLVQSVNDFQTLATEYASLGDRQDAAGVQDGLGSALCEEGSRSSNDKALPLLNQAVQAYKKALELLSKTDSPRDWARTEGNLGVALWDEGRRTDGDQAVALFDQAVQAIRNALEVHTKADSPQDWGNAEVTLGNVLQDEGERAGGEKGMALLDQAVQAYQKVLEVWTKTDLPHNWAMAQNNLASAREQEAMRSSGDKSSVFFDQAVKAYQQAFQVSTKAELPQDWAMTENDLGNLYWEEGRRAGADKAASFFDQAVQNYRNALEVYTRAELPQDWARTEGNLANALEDQGSRSSGDKATALFEQAIQAYRNALEVYTKADLPQDWSRTETNLGNALQDEGSRSAPDKAMVLLDEAAQAFRHALEVRTKADLPRDWAATENNLGNTLGAESMRATGDKAATLTDQAVQAYREALEVFTKADSPLEWAETESNLGNVLKIQGDGASADRAAALFDQAVQVYQEALEVRTKSDLPQDWASTEFNLGNALLDEGQRSSPDKAPSLFDQAAQAYQHALEVFTKSGFPQQWATASLYLASIYSVRSRYDDAAAIYESLLEAFPNSADILTAAGGFDHEIVFRFDESFELADRMVKLDPSPANRLGLVEADLTAARFDDCLQQSQMIANTALDPPYIPVRDALALGCDWGKGTRAAALSTDKALLSEAQTAKTGAWTFAGTLHFLSTSPAFETGRASWIALFTSVQNGDGAGMTAALHQLEPLLQP